MHFTQRGKYSARTAALLHGLLTLVSGGFVICWAQPDPEPLPMELRSTQAVEKLKEVFCMRCEGVDQPPPTLARPVLPLCEQLCRTDDVSHNHQCWDLGTQGNVNCEEENQFSVCAYQDANVCQYEDMRGSCVYHRNRAFCICKDEAGYWLESPMESCVVEPDESGGQDRPVNPELPPPPTTQSAMCPFGADPQNDRLCLPPPLPTGPASSATTPRGGGADARTAINLPALALGCVLSAVLLLVIIGVGVWCHWHRRGPTARHETNNTKVEGSSCTKLDENAPNTTTQLPDSLVPDEVHDYAYVDSHWGQELSNPEKEEPRLEHQMGQEDHYYFKLHKNTEEGSVRYVGHAPKDDSARPSASAEAPSDPQYFILEKEEDLGKEESKESGSAPVAHKDDHNPATLPTKVQPFLNENSGYEVARVATVAKGETESPQYDHLNRVSDKRPREAPISVKDSGAYDSLGGHTNYNHIVPDQ
ncbi:uncharacterized protein LOC110986747 [Acanthaster planci]|uniref:Uncharacterized protein LOC110986747 n=1 Tax=Acanthaster planci TaxID=133434 RepID=A0A8B7ZG66_ACAPL|nr:uncharacterized protein LOC110986747 [Acanthaster planci]